MTTLIIKAVIGSIAGVLINYLADVLPISRRITQPTCLNCGTLFNLRDYLFAFKCKKCGNRTSTRVIIVTSFAIIGSVLLHFYPIYGLNYWASLPVLIFLGLILVVDIEYRVVLIQTSIFGVVLFLIYGLILHGFWLTVKGGFAGFIVMILLYYMGILFNKIVGKIKHQEIDEVALGFGDVYVSGFLGLFTGWPTIIGAILIGILASGVFSIMYILYMVLTRRYKAFSAIPYTPFLILGALATFYIS